MENEFPTMAGLNMNVRPATASVLLGSKAQQLAQHAVPPIRANVQAAKSTFAGHAENAPVSNL